MIEDETGRRGKRRKLGQQARIRHSIGAQVTPDEYARLELEWQTRGCTPTDLVRGALRLDSLPPRQPLLVAAGQLIRAGNAHAGAIQQGDRRVAQAQVERLEKLAIHLIQLAIAERTR